MKLDTNMSYGGGIYYDPENPFQGNRFSFWGQVEFQPIWKLRQIFSYTYQQFDRKGTGDRVFDLDILVSQTSYQFNRYLFIRGLVQYDSYRQVVLTDLLASFTLIPGTVIHVGYGSLYEKQNWNPVRESWEQQVDMGRYYQTRQSLFLKVSYLYRF